MLFKFTHSVCSESRTESRASTLALRGPAQQGPANDAQPSEAQPWKTQPWEAQPSEASLQPQLSRVAP